MVTYQDYLKAVGENPSPTKVAAFVQYAISAHKSSDEYDIAKTADLYDRQKNKTINEYVRNIFTLAGAPIEDFTASNNKIASNFFHRLNTQRCTYSLGNGIFFANDENGELKESLGEQFDRAVFDAGYYALIHGLSFGFWNLDKLHVFPLTEFVPLWDEFDGTLKAGVRFWQIDDSKPMIAVLYELDGYTRFQTVKKEESPYRETQYELVMAEEKKPYKVTVYSNEAGDEEVVGEYIYSDLPIVPFWGSKLHQSTLVGMRQSIDSFDLIRSGFANDLTDCAEIYWIIENYGGMTDDDLMRFRDRMKINHIVEVPAGGNGQVQPYTQDIPFAARKAYMDEIRAGIYEDFGGLDVHEVHADSTNDHLEAAYQPMDENADDFEYQCIEFIQQILTVAGFEMDTPIFKRNRISNTKEQVDMVMAEAEYLDEETILNKLPNITPDEVAEILARKDKEDRDRMARNPFIQEQQQTETEDEDEENEQ